MQAVVRLARSALLFHVCCAATAQSGARFVENTGQWPEKVTFRSELPGATIWCERDAVVIDLYDASLVASAHGEARVDPTTGAHEFLQQHALRLRFLSATGTAEATGVYPLQGHHSYLIGNDPGRWTGRNNAFAAVDLKNVAPGCDARFRQGGSGLKYDLIVAPGADPGAIRFTYEGADELRLQGSALIVQTSLGRLTERIPLAYQDVGEERRVIACRYTLKNGVIGVRPGPYDSTQPLIIDPTLAFATYSGSVSNNFGYSATFDAQGFLYAGSTAFGTQYPVTMGAYQTAWAGGTTDIALTKYDTTGTFLVWSTYLGGGAAEMPHSLIVAPNGQLLVLGTTASVDFPISTSGFDATFGGGTAFTPVGLGLSYPNGSDMIIARLAADGSSLLGSTYLGGSSNDGLNSAPGLKFNYADEVRGEVLLDDDGNVWITSCTQSADLPTTTTAVQNSFAGGSHDGYLARFDPLLTTLQYATYIGGSGADAVYAGELDALGRLYITGGTNSVDLDVSSTALQTTFNGGAADAFVARVDPASNTTLALSYWGSSAYDQSYFVELDGDGGVYLFGQTSAPAGLLILNTPYNLPGGGQFITKLDADLSTLVLSSRVGSGDGTPDISPTAFLVDVCNKIYTSGWGSSNAGLGGSLTTAGLPVTPDAHQSSTDGQDLYLAVFEIDMSSLSYATFYGGAISPEHVDGGTSRFDRRGRVYQSVCAGCQNNDDFPTSPNAWSATNNSTGCNNGVLKFDFDAPLVIAAFANPDTVCGPLDVAFQNLSSRASSYLWDFGDGATSANTSPTHSYAMPGTYTITLTAFNPVACNEEDVVQGTIVVEPAGSTVVAMNDTLICGPVSSLVLTANSSGTGDTFIWSSSSAFTDTLNFPALDSMVVLSPAVSGTYHVRALNSGSCFAQDSVQVTVSLAAIQLIGDSLLCLGDVGNLLLLGADVGASIEWQPAEEISAGQGTPVAQVAPLTDTGYGVTVTAPTGCTWSGTISISVSSVAGSSVSASAQPTVVLMGSTVQLQATPNEGVTYTWVPAVLLNDASIAAPTAVVEQTTTFLVTVSDGICTRDASATVEVRDLLCADPDIFVPNTFTPNGDGNNDVLFVRGRAVERLEFMIFDRWGEKVFETTDQGTGWDGTYGGKPVDPAVFVYHLTAYCVDGQRFFTKGNVTVVR